MLQTQAVEPALLELLTALTNNSLFEDYYLVGGTALALQIGHRHSVDIDLFSSNPLIESDITPALMAFGKTTILSKSKNILIYSVNGIKVDFVYYQYRWIQAPLIKNKIKIASKADIAAMKLNAISGRGSKKDFIDLFFLLKECSLNEMIEFYKQKYPEGSEFLVLKSMCYFDDADQEPSPVMLVDINWEKIKKTIIKQVEQII
jgi:predicted nucleotidyltransferase component of viral defense system